MKKIIFSILLICFSSFSFAQKMQIESVTFIQYQKQPFNLDLQKKLFQLMESQNYSALFSEIFQMKSQKIDFIEYLHNLKFFGHPPIYWLMADYYTSVNNPLEAHKWLYAATITTQQDASLCLDSSAMFATQRISNFFPEVRTLTAKTPNLIDPAMKDVIFFVQNLKERPSALWACYYGTANVNEYDKKKEPELINKNDWKERRDEVFKKYTLNFSK